MKEQPFDKAALYVTLSTDVLNQGIFKRIYKHFGKSGIYDTLLITFRLASCDGFKMNYEVSDLADDCDSEESQIIDLLLLLQDRNWIIKKDMELSLTDLSIERVIGKLVQNRKNRYNRNQRYTKGKDIPESASSVPELGLDGNKPKKTPAKKKGFVPPTQEQVVEYLLTEKHQPLGLARKMAERFWLHYDTKGWMVGKNSMVNWKSAATGSIKWEGNNAGNEGPDRSDFNRK